MDITVSAVELYIRVQMLKVRRTLKPGVPVCDMCGVEAGNQRHHIITRYSTMGNLVAEARRIANGPLLTAMLCQTCHDTIDTTDNRNALLQKLYLINGRGSRRVGYELMKKEYDRVARVMKMDWTLPPPDYPTVK